MYVRFDVEEFLDFLPDIWNFFGDSIVVSGFDPCDRDETLAAVHYLQGVGVLGAGFFPQYSTLKIFGDVASKAKLSMIRVPDQESLTFFCESQYQGDTLALVPYSKETAELLNGLLSKRMNGCHFRGYTSTYEDLRAFSEISDSFLIVDDKEGVNLFISELFSLSEKRQLVLEKIMLNANSTGENLGFHKYFAKRE